MKNRNLVALATKDDLTWEDWLILTKRIENRIYCLLSKFSLKPLSEVLPVESSRSYKLSEIGDKLHINAENVTLQTRGIFGTLYFDSGVEDRSQSRTRYKFGYTKDEQWLLISVTYHESPENTKYEAYLDEVTVSGATLEDLLQITPYPSIIWRKLGDVLDEWYKKSADRLQEVTKVREDYEFIEKLMNHV